MLVFQCQHLAKCVWHPSKTPSILSVQLVPIRPQWLCTGHLKWCQELLEVAASNTRDISYLAPAAAILPLPLQPSRPISRRHLLSARTSTSCMVFECSWTGATSVARLHIPLDNSHCRQPVQVVYSRAPLHAVPPGPGVPVQVLLGGRPQPQVGPHLRLRARLPRDRVELAHLQSRSARS